MDIDYGALFGIDEGGKEQEIADPATDETTQAQGAEEQEAADPAEEETQDTSAEEPQGAAEDGEDHGRDAEEFKRWAKNDFDAAIGDTIGDLRTVKRYADERAAKAPRRHCSIGAIR